VGAAISAAELRQQQWQRPNGNNNAPAMPQG